MMDLLSDQEIKEEYVLSKIIRYNHRCRLQDESVAEHSFFVSIFCLKILSKLDLDPQVERDVLIAAILHDTPESKTSDIPHDVKTNYPEMNEILERIEKDYYEESWSKYINEINMENYLVHYIVKLADAYSVYQYCLNETALGNVSKDIIEIKNDSLKRITRKTNMINMILEQEKNKDA